MSEDFTPEPQAVEPKAAPISTPDNKPNPAEKTLPTAETPKPEKKDLDTILKDSLKKSQDKSEGKEEAKKPEPKSDPKVEAKAQPKTETAEEKAERLRAPDGKFAPKEGAKEPAAEPVADAERNGQDGEKPRPSEGRSVNEPPARFLPAAKEAWPSLPEIARKEIHRMESELLNGLSEYKESHEFRKELKPFEEMAKSAGVNFNDAIKNYVEIDQMVTANPVEGVRRILQAQNIDLVQFAQHVLGQAQQAQQDPKGAALNQYQQREQQLQQQLQQQAQQLEEMKRTAIQQEIEQKFIAPFAQHHPRYHELQDDIAFFLNSGKVPSNLSAQERLAAAYDYAVRINPAPSQNDQEPLTPAPATMSLNPAGQKSVTGSPSSTAVKSTKTKGDATDLDAVLRRALSKAS